jgi:hypothetical protein
VGFAYIGSIFPNTTGRWSLRLIETWSPDMNGAVVESGVESEGAGSRVLDGWVLGTETKFPHKLIE